MSDTVTEQQPLEGYFADRQSKYEQEQGNTVKSNSIATRRLQVLGAHKQFVISLPISIIRVLGLHEQDLMKITVDANGIIQMKKVNLE